MKRPSLFALPSKSEVPSIPDEVKAVEQPVIASRTGQNSMRPKSRQGKRIASVYLEPEALRQLQKMAFDEETSLQALMCEALNALFESRGLTRLA